MKKISLFNIYYEIKKIKYHRSNKAQQKRKEINKIIVIIIKDYLSRVQIAVGKYIITSGGKIYRKIFITVHYRITQHIKQDYQEVNLHKTSFMYIINYGECSGGVEQEFTTDYGNQSH